MEPRGEGEFAGERVDSTANNGALCGPDPLYRTEKCSKKDHYYYLGPLTNERRAHRLTDCIGTGKVARRQQMDTIPYEIEPVKDGWQYRRRWLPGVRSQVERWLP